MATSYTTRIDKIDPGHYRIIINLGRDPNKSGKYNKKRRDVHGTKPEAEAVLREMLDELERPPVKTFSLQTTGDYLLHWVDTIVKPDLETNTYESYKWEIEKHIKPSIGHIPICELLPIHVQTFYSYKLEAGRLDGKGGLSNRSVVYLHSILNQSLTKAVDLELIEKNPCDKIKPPRDKKHHAESMVCLSKEELRDFLIGARDHRDYALIYIGAFTGMRQSEILGLTWDNILWNEKAIRVLKAMHKLESGEFEHRSRTKNFSSNRKIEVTDDVLEILREQRKKQMEVLQKVTPINKKKKEEKEEEKEEEKNVLVFPTLDGKPQDRKAVYHRFKNMAKKLGHEKMRFHDLRHTHATILLSEGEMINAVAERLGHADVETTLKTYAHVLPKKAKQTAERFGQLINFQNN